MPHPPPPADVPDSGTEKTTHLTWSQVLEEEDRVLLGLAQDSEASPRRDATGGGTEEEEARRLKAIIARLHSRGRSALCLSGGGVRSATFALGVLQGLANAKILDRFDYLSTVSGGGYIGGWLTAWLHREDRAAVLTALDPEQASHHVRTTRSPVDRVRETCRFLAPQGGLLSADVWALLATLGRNLILNWLVLLPLIGAALLVPHAYYALVQAMEVTLPGPPPAETVCLPADQPAFWLLAITVAAFGVQTGYIALNFAGRGAKWSQRAFLVFVLVPSVLGSLAFTLFWSAYPCEPTLSGFLFFGGVIPAAGWLVVGVFARPSLRTALPAAAAAIVSLYAWSEMPADTRDPLAQVVRVVIALLTAIVLIALGRLSSFLHRHERRARRGQVQIFASGRTVAAALVSGPVLGGGLYLLIDRYFPLNLPFTEAYAVFAVPSILVIWTLATVMFIGLAGDDFSDAALEWWSRCFAWVGIAVVAWLAAFVFDFYLADLIERAVQATKSDVKTEGLPIEVFVAILIPLLSSLAGLAGRSSPDEKQRSLLGGFLASAGLPLVILVLLSFIAWADARALQVYGGEEGTFYEAMQVPVSRVLWLGGGLLAVGLLMSRFVPVNRFSLNGMYRQRLMRTFLGASNPTREPNAFTGFDPNDDLRIHELAGVRPLHIVNATLNALSETDVGRNDRTAQSFTFSPLHVGSRLPDFGYRRAGGYHSDGNAAPPGLSLGLALAVSGAAASSAMGIYSSKARAFLLTLANARLGLWFGNPGNDTTWCVTEPPLGVGPLVHEMLGLTSASNPYVYLSDGGHFENLGLYEMVARRCHCIVVSDAGCDADYRYDSLADAIRRIRLDFGIPIEFDGPLAASRAGQGKGNPHGAVGVIRYSVVDGPAAPDGVLLYLKTTLSGSEPADVWNFAMANPAFPHDPTTDQFFDEARFESYRLLGYTTVREVVGRDFVPGGDVEAFCDAARRSLAAHRSTRPAGVPSAAASLQALAGESRLSSTS